MDQLRHRDRLARFPPSSMGHDFGGARRRFSDEHKTLYEKLARLPIEELIYLRDEQERIRVQEQRSKFKVIKGGRGRQRDRGSYYER